MKLFKILNFGAKYSFGKGIILGRTHSAKAHFVHTYNSLRAAQCDQMLEWIVAQFVWKVAQKWPLRSSLKVIFFQMAKKLLISGLHLKWNLSASKKTFQNSPIWSHGSEGNWHSQKKHFGIGHLIVEFLIKTLGFEQQTLPASSVNRWLDCVFYIWLFQQKNLLNSSIKMPT